jgi:hypothetical protein
MVAEVAVANGCDGIVTHDQRLHRHRGVRTVSVDSAGVPEGDWSEMSTLSLRLPESMHRQLAEMAKREGVSINQLINSAVGESWPPCRRSPISRSERSARPDGASTVRCPRLPISSQTTSTVSISRRRRTRRCNGPRPAVSARCQGHVRRGGIVAADRQGRCADGEGVLSA